MVRLTPEFEYELRCLRGKFKVCLANARDLTPEEIDFYKNQINKINAILNKQNKSYINM